MSDIQAMGQSKAIRVAASGCVSTDVLLVAGVLIEAPGTSGYWNFLEQQTLINASSTFTAAADDKLTNSGGDPWFLNGIGGLPTGMRVSLSNSGGGLPPATPVLAAGTPYWVIRDTPTTIKLASNLANALAGIAIDISGPGTGTHTISWPLTHELRYPEMLFSDVKAGDFIRFCDADFSKFQQMYIGVPAGGIAHLLVYPR
jgi:hypothetical protein